jgi:hypothetical protein
LKFRNNSCCIRIRNPDPTFEISPDLDASKQLCFFALLAEILAKGDGLRRIVKDERMCDCTVVKNNKYKKEWDNATNPLKKLKKNFLRINFQVRRVHDAEGLAVQDRF